MYKLSELKFYIKSMAEPQVVINMKTLIKTTMIKDNL